MVFFQPFDLIGSDRIGLDWIGSDWIGLDWIGQRVSAHDMYKKLLSFMKPSPSGSGSGSGSTPTLDSGVLWDQFLLFDTSGKGLTLTLTLAP